MEKDKNKTINWKKIHDKYKKLVGDENYKLYCNPFEHDIKNNRHIIDLSQRDTGKTTNWIIILLIVYQEYGYSFAYLRSNEVQVTIGRLKTLYNVIVENDYINKLTNGAYNDYIYDRGTKTWTLYNRDTNEADIEPFCYGLSTDKWDDYKSTLNLPKCETILFDEFINTYNRANEFIDLSNVMSTVFRHRTNNPRVVYLANTITKYSQWYSELGIAKVVKYMHIDDIKEVVTTKGTHLSIRLLGNRLTNARKEVNSLLYGFENPLLNSITGGDWSIKNYPHITRDMDIHTVQKNVYLINFYNEYAAADLIYESNNKMTYIYYHEISLDKLNQFACPVFTNMDDVRTNNSMPLIEADLTRLKELKIFYYQNNDIGDLIDNCIDFCKN